MENVSRDEAIQSRQLGTDEKTGKPISVRMGRYGPFVQIGTRDDEEKPRFAGLRPGQKMDSITLEEALELFKLPRELGVSPEGEKISTNIGRFGPYVKYDDKFVSLKVKEGDDPYTITLERALELVAEKKEFDANREIKVFEGTDIKILRGRYGPYITDGNKNARITQGRRGSRHAGSGHLRGNDRKGAAAQIQAQERRHERKPPPRENRQQKGYNQKSREKEKKHGQENRQQKGRRQHPVTREPLESQSFYPSGGARSRVRLPDRYHPGALAATR